MSHSKIHFSISGKLDEIKNYLGKYNGFQFRLINDGIELLQLVDRKKIVIRKLDIQEVISRVDSEGKLFLQVNYNDGRKILITENLVGFKPIEVNNLDMTRIPKVVTTPDLFNVIEALEDALEGQNVRKADIEILKKVYHSILKGAEIVGFDAASEKELYHNLVIRKIKGCA